MDVTKERYNLDCQSWSEDNISEIKYKSIPRSIKRAAVVGNILNNVSLPHEVIKPKILNISPLGGLKNETIIKISKQK